MDIYTLRFIVKDEQNKCRFKYADTLSILVSLSPPDNTAPDLTIENLKGEMPFVNGKLSVILGQEISMNLVATDPELNPTDHLKLSLIDAFGTIDPDGFNFTRAEGLGTVQSPFTWIPGCGIFQNNIFENEYTFVFQAIDDRCMNVLSDTLTLDVVIRDVAANENEFIPPNIITPNGDGCNDFFALDGFDAGVIDGACGEFIAPNLPNDNCQGRFNSVRIYNRWGKLIFESAQRNFRWYATNEASGVYFYTLMYTHPETKEKNIEYKGTITVRY
jgi:hypothetical protein